MNVRCEECPVRDSAACSVLTEEEREALAKTGRNRVLKRGELLFAAGDEASACATLTKGALKVCSYDSEGDEHILALIHPAGFTGEMFAPFATHDVVALTESELCVFPKTELSQAIERYPALSLALLRRAEEDLHKSRDLAALSTRKSAEARIAGLIMGLAGAASESPCHPAQTFELPLTRGEMANMLGLTIETVSRRISTLEKDGIIARKGKRGIELLDPAHLRQLAA